MKLSVGKRILMFIHWLLSLLICAAFAVYVIAPDFAMRCYDMAEAALGIRRLRIAGIVLLAVYAVLAAVQVCLIFKRGKRSERGFITVDSSDSGKVRIAISAIEQMVRQSVTNIEGITEMKIGIDNQEDAIAIVVNASIINGSHVPTITMNMQRAIRQFVEMNCGVAVRAVSISINAVTEAQESSRRRRGGRRKAEPVAAAPQPSENTYSAYAHEDEVPVASPASPEPEHWETVSQDAPYGEASADEPVSEEIAAENDAQEIGAPEATAYDFDRPYESEFAKDLAAMRAAESEAAEPSGEDGNSAAQDEAY